MRGTVVVISEHEHEMLDDFDTPGGPATSLHLRMAAPRSVIQMSDAGANGAPQAHRAHLMTWWRTTGAFTEDEIGSLDRLSLTLDSVVRWFAGLVLDVLQDLAPASSDLLAVALSDARVALDISPEDAWLVPGARSLAVLFLGAEPSGRLRAGLGVSEDRTEEHWPPATEQAGPSIDTRERPWRQPLEEMLQSIWDRDSIVPATDRRRAQLGLAWHCGAHSRVCALSLSVHDHRRSAELAVSAGVDLVATLAQFKLLATPGRSEQLAEFEPSTPPPRPSPLHRWTWQRVLMFGLLVALSLWMYLGDK